MRVYPENCQSKAKLQTNIARKTAIAMIKIMLQITPS